MTDVRDIRVIGTSGDHDGDTGVVSVWPIFDRQDWVNVLWSDGTVASAGPGEIAVPDEAKQLTRKACVEKRIIALSRMSKRTLVITAERLARERGSSWLYGGPAAWSKDELITHILNEEFEVN